jgi:CRP/FNR family transcriptional regulator, cyclic AMP receptor protein
MQDDLQTTVNFLSRVPLFHGLEPNQLKQIGKRFRQRNYPAGEVIVEQGKLGVGLFIVETGSAEVCRTRPDGTNFVMSTLHPTDFFGELALLDEAPRSASVIALENTQCLALTQLDFIDALRDDPDMAIEVLKELARRFRRALENL